MKNQNGLETAKRRFVSCMTLVSFITWSTSAMAGQRGGGGTIARLFNSGFGKFLKELTAFATGEALIVIGTLVTVFFLYKLAFGDDKKGAAKSLLISSTVFGIIAVAGVFVEDLFTASGGIV